MQDLEACVDFYRDVVGLNIAYERPKARAVFFSNQNTYHDLALMDINGPMGNGRNNVLHHLAFELENEVDLVAGYERALARGVEFLTTQSHEVAHSVYVNDPESNGIEIYADVVANWQDVRTGVINKEKKDWKPGDTPPVAESCYPVDPAFDYFEGAAFRTIRAAHACVVARRYDEMVTFYTEVVGLTPLVRGKGFTVLAGSLGQPALSLVEEGEGRRPGLHHINFELADQAALADGKKALQERGVTATYTVDTDAKHGIYLTDPNGLLVQMFVDGGGGVAALGGVEADKALLSL